MPSMIKLVAIGRLMNSSDMFICTAARSTCSPFFFPAFFFSAFRASLPVAGTREPIRRTQALEPGFPKRGPGLPERIQTWLRSDPIVLVARAVHQIRLAGFGAAARSLAAELQA